MKQAVPCDPVPRDAVGETAAVAARAFADDGMFTFVFPDRPDRERRLPRFFRGAVRYGRGVGGAVTTPDRAGVAIWLPPGRATMSVARLVRSGMAAFPVTLGPTAFRRFTAYTGWLDQQRRELVPGPHWFLLALAVDPTRQREGIGTALMQSALGDADRQALPAYLETTTPANVDYYARAGFEVVREAVPSQGPRTWLMVRPPS